MHTSESVPQLVAEIEELKKRCISLQEENARLQSLLYPEPSSTSNTEAEPTITAKRWQELGNQIITANMSRQVPTYEFNYASGRGGDCI